MLNRKNQLLRNQVVSAGLILLLLLVAAPVAAQSVDAGGISYSGDDPYDPAAGGLPAISLNQVPLGSVASSATSLSGDDAYDPAADGLEPLENVWVSEWAARRDITTLSGDDDYDPAAGGTPQLYAAVPGPSSEVACAPSESQLEARSALSVEGGYSGDDAYDPAAGGTPELSLLEIGVDLLACAPIV